MNTDNFLKKNKNKLFNSGFIFIKPQKHYFQDNISLNSTDENTSSTMISITTNYLTRYLLLKEMNNSKLSEIECKEKAFLIPKKGSQISNKEEEFNDLLKKINAKNYEIDNETVINAMQISNFTFFYWIDDFKYEKIKEANPDKETINNIKIMIQRSVSFFKNHDFYECSLLFDDAFQYTKCITKADANFMSKKTLWNFTIEKEMKKEKNHLIKLLTYYSLSKKIRNSENSIYKDLDSVGVFNPWLNVCFFWKIKDIDKNLICEIDLLI